jgi:hypothetical protein
MEIDGKHSSPPLLSLVLSFPRDKTSPRAFSLDRISHLKRHGQGGRKGGFEKEEAILHQLRRRKN